MHGDNYANDPCLQGFNQSSARASCSYISPVTKQQGNQCVVMIKCAGASSLANQPQQVTYTIIQGFKAPKYSGFNPGASGVTPPAWVIAGNLFNCQGVAMVGTPQANDPQLSTTDACAVPANCQNLENQILLQKQIQNQKYYFPGCHMLCNDTWTNNAPQECVNNTASGPNVPATIVQQSIESAQRTNTPRCKVVAQCMFKFSQKTFQTSVNFNPNDYFKVCPSSTGGSLVASSNQIVQCN